MKMTLIDLETARLSYPRVSDIIGKQNEAELRGIPLEVLADASIRGTQVHAYCTALVKGLWVSDIELEYKPYVDGFTEWYEENVHQTLYSSVRLYDDVKRFTGEFDLIVVMKKTKQIALLDLKCTWKASKSWPIQLAAYKHLCDLNGFGEIEAIYNLHLKTTKGPQYENTKEKKGLISPPEVKTILIPHQDLNKYWNIFSSALACFDYFDRKESK